MKRGCVGLTRPRAASERLAADIRARGFTPVIAPMLDIVPEHFEWPTMIQALIITSANTVPLIPVDPALPVFAVGDATAAAAKAAGFQNIESAGGDARDLQALLSQRTWQPDIPVVHAGGADLAATLSIPGVPVRHIPVYKARAAETLPDEFIETLDQGAFDAILFFSPRTGRIFSHVLGEYGRTGRLTGTKALCLSGSVVESVKDLPWADVRSARHPNMAALLALLDGDHSFN